MVFFCSVCWETRSRAMYAVHTFFFQERALLAFLLLFSEARVIVVVLAGLLSAKPEVQAPEPHRLCKLGSIWMSQIYLHVFSVLAPRQIWPQRRALCLKDLTTTLCQSCIPATCMPNPAWFDLAWLGLHRQWRGRMLLHVLSVSIKLTDRSSGFDDLTGFKSQMETYTTSCDTYY